MSNSEEDTYSVVFGSLKHPIRRKILRMLSAQAASFTDLQRQMSIESSHLTYHLESLGSLLLRTEDGKYSLSSLGQAAATMMRHVEDPSATSLHFSFPSTRATSILKALAFLLVCTLVASLVFNGVFLLRLTESDKANGILDKAYDGLYQAYIELNRTHNALNQAYEELNKTNNRLENAYTNLNETYLSLLSNAQSNRVFNINSGIEYETIQDAINAAGEGNTILVGRGVYYEHLTVNKSLTLVGASKDDTVIDGSHKSIVVTIAANNVVFQGFTVQHSGADQIGIDIVHSNSSIVRENVVTLNGMFGVALDGSFNSSVSGNIISSTIGSTVGLTYGDGIRIWRLSAGNFITDNIIINSTATGIDFDGSGDNMIMRNLLQENGEAVFAHSSSNNTFSHNNFIHNYGSVTEEFSSNNNWSVEGEGNYWDDYTGLDDGSNGRVAGDGVGDTNLPWHGVDNYPLISPVNPVQVFWDNQVFPTLLSSNSTISTFNFDQTGKRITFSVTGPSNTKGCFNLSMPVTLLSGPWEILVDGIDATSQAIITENETQTSIQLSYNQTGHYVQVIGFNVIPEYPTICTLLIVLLVALVSALLVRATHKKNFIRKTDARSSLIPAGLSTDLRA